MSQNCDRAEYGHEKSIFSKPTLTERLIANAPNLDIHVIPDASSGAVCQKRRNHRFHVTAVPVRDLAKSILVLLASTLVGYVFLHDGLF